VTIDPVVSAIRDAFALILPEAILVLAACVLFLGGTFKPHRHLWAVVALVALAAAGLALYLGAPLTPTVEARQETLDQKRRDLGPMPPGEERAQAEESLKEEREVFQAAVFAGPLLINRLALYVKWIALIGGTVLVLFSWEAIPEAWAAEYHACLLLITAGLCLTGSANELVILFLALELISIPTYVLLYLARHDKAAQEAAMKYFLLSIFSSALLLFGFSYLYGLAGTTNIPALLAALAGAGPTALPGVALVAVVMVVAGLGFKITAVPFHYYAPDVYQGTTPAVAAVLAFVPKAAGFIALLRLLGFVTPDSLLRATVSIAQLPTLFLILAVATMTLGNILALLQDNLRRLLAYSSVAHAGYMLIGLAAASARGPGDKFGLAGIDAVLFYLVAYGAMTIGAFAVIAYLNTHEPPHPTLSPTGGEGRVRGRPVENVEDLAGLSSGQPGLALLLTLFLFSLIGIPFTAGFVGKLLVFQGALAVPGGADGAAVDQAQRFRILALIGAINAAIGGWYYLRIVVMMYLRDSTREVRPARSWPGLAAIAACAVVTILFGVYPEPLSRLAHEAVPRSTPTAGSGQAAAQR
jgi:NADH-quinone oxidoreductase subunit N